VRSSAPEYTITSCSVALVTASRNSWRSVLLAGVALADQRVAGQDVVAVARGRARERAVVHAEQRDDPVGDRAHRGEAAHREGAGAEAGPRRAPSQRRLEQRDDVRQAQRRRPGRPSRLRQDAGRLVLLPGVLR